MKPNYKEITYSNGINLETCSLAYLGLDVRYYSSSGVPSRLWSLSAQLRPMRSLMQCGLVGRQRLLPLLRSALQNMCVIAEVSGVHARLRSQREWHLHIYCGNKSVGVDLDRLWDSADFWPDCSPSFVYQLVLLQLIENQFIYKEIMMIMSETLLPRLRHTCTPMN